MYAGAHGRFDKTVTEKKEEKKKRKSRKKKKKMMMMKKKKKTGTEKQKHGRRIKQEERGDGDGKRNDLPRTEG